MPKATKRPPRRSGPGRPTMYSPELADEICTRVGLRESMSQICSLPGMPTERTILAWRLRHDDFAEKLERARQHRALARADKIDDYVAQLAAGKLDPNAARVMIDAEKWQASKELPKRYGDKITTEVSGPGGQPVQVESTAAVRALVEALPELLNGKVIDAAALLMPAEPLPDDGKARP
jgi:hypothetical protein